jgi:anti-sigma28 factor (negative regulator of flagellin synthesis)
MSDAPEKTEKKTLEQFLASIPEPPSSGMTEPKAEAAEGDAPKGEPSEPEQTTASKSSDGAETAEPTSSASDDPVQAIRQALKDGNLDALAEAVGEDPALFSEKSTKWAAARRKEKRLKEERDTAAAKAEAVLTKTQPVFDLAGRVQQGEFTALPELIEYLTGVDYDQLVLKVARARHGSDPQVEVLKKRLAELEPKVAERETARETAAERALLETLRDEVDTKHQVRALAGWEAKVAAELKASYDEDLGEPSISPRQAADRVLRKEREEFEAKAKVFGGGEAPARAAKERAPERASGAAPAKRKKLDRDAWLAQFK